MSHSLATTVRLVDSLPDAAALLDHELTVHHFNSSLASLLDMRLGALRREFKNGTKLFELLDGRQHGLDEERARSCLTTHVPLTLAEVELSIRGEKAIIVSATLIPIKGKHRSHLLLVLRDYSAEAALHRRYRHMLAAERSRAERLETTVRERTQELTAALEEVTRLSRTDSLTGLLNRRAFEELARARLDQACITEKHCAILLADLDHFKLVNDTHGHPAGDAVLTAVAQQMRDLHRSSDTLCRWGGEEFALFLDETDQPGLAHAAQRVTEIVRALPIHEVIPGAAFQQTISVGCALYPEHGEDLESLIRNADLALYKAKREGRNRAVVASDTASPTGVKREPLSPRVLLISAQSDCTDAIRRALADHYQLDVRTDPHTALGAVDRANYEVIIADDRIPGGAAQFLSRTLPRKPSSLRMIIAPSDNSADALSSGRHSKTAHIVISEDDAKASLLQLLDTGMNARGRRTATPLPHPEVASDTTQCDNVALTEILASRNVTFFYQPILHTHDKSTFAYEALLRSPTSSSSSPTGVVDAAVKDGSIWRLGRLVREVTAKAAQSLDRNILLFINMHPTETDDPLLFDCTQPHMQHPERIVFELTERTLIHDFPRLRASVKKLRDRGFRFAIDDLGGGFASLTSIVLLDVDFIKLDMSIIRGISHSHKKMSLVRRILDYANEVGVQIVAEGIETEQEAQTIEALGCHLVQGYFYGKPKPRDSHGF